MSAEQGINGNPYQGLMAFNYEHSDRFFGRDDAIRLAVEKLKLKAAANKPFLLLLGKNGMGKSSLIEAGILPALNVANTIPGVTQFLHASIKSSDLSLDPIKGLVSALCTATAGHLFEQEQIRELTSLCKENPQQFFTMIDNKLSTLTNGVRLIVVVKQLERVFLNQSINAAHRRYFADILHRLCTQYGVFLIFSIRSDFYQNLSDIPSLMLLKQSGGQMDVLPPSLEQIKQAISLPAEKAGLSFEDSKQGLGKLQDVIAKRAEELPESLPVLQFTLAQLYAGRSANGMMTFSTYRKIGGLDSAIAKHAEQVYSNLDRNIKKHFTRVFTRLAERGNSGGYERVWANVDDLIITERAHVFVQAFVDAGLLVNQTNAEGVNMIAIVHDCLIQQWSRLSDCLESNQAILRLKNAMSKQAEEWQTATRPSAYLLKPGKALDEGRSLLKHGGTLEPKVKHLIQASIKRLNLKRWAFSVLAIVVVLSFSFTIYQTYNAKLVANAAEKRLEDSHKLIEFLIEDEHRELEKIGRLDVMRAGSDRSLEYFLALERVDESSAAKLSRSKTFFKLGKVYLETKHYEQALNAFNQTLTLDNELVQIHPNGFNYVFELAQAQYWIATTYLMSGDLNKAEQHFLAYQKTAFDLVELKPDDLSAKLELSRAFYFMATIAVQRQQNERATQHYLDAIKFGEKARIVADDEELQLIASAYQWLAEKYQSDLKITEAADMSKGEIRTRQSLLAAQRTSENTLALLMAQWQAIEKLIWAGQNKQSLIMLKDLQNDSELMSVQNEQGRYIFAFALSKQGQLSYLSGKQNEAREFFRQSFSIVEDLPQTGVEHWIDAFYERQYWYTRLLNLISSPEQQNSANIINQAEHAAALKWQVRIAVLLDLNAAIPSLADIRNITDPNVLIAYLELATKLEDQQSLPLLRDLVPQEMWLNSDLDAMRSKIRQILATPES